MLSICKDPQKNIADQGVVLGLDSEKPQSSFSPRQGYSGSGDPRPAGPDEVVNDVLIPDQKTAIAYPHCDEVLNAAQE